MRSRSRRKIDTVRRLDSVVISTTRLLYWTWLFQLADSIVENQKVFWVQCAAGYRFLWWGAVTRMRDWT